MDQVTPPHRYLHAETPLPHLSVPSLSPPSYTRTGQASDRTLWPVPSLDPHPTSSRILPAYWSPRRGQHPLPCFLLTAVPP